MMVYSIVKTALETALKTYADSATVPVAWENRKFPKDDIYFRASLLPAEPGNLGLGDADNQDHQGIFQVDVVVQKSTQTSVVQPLVTGVVTAFAKNTDLGNGVRVVKSWPTGSVELNESRYIIPVSVHYRALL